MMSYIKIECPNCKAALTMEHGRSHMFCEYCGTQVSTDDIEIYREDAKTDRIKTITNSINSYATRVTELSHERKMKAEENKVRNALIAVGLFLLAFVIIKLL